MQFWQTCRTFSAPNPNGFFQCSHFLIFVKSAFVSTLSTAHDKCTSDKCATFLSPEFRTFHSNSGKKSYVIWIFPTELTLGTRKMKFSPCWRKHFAQTVCVQNQEKSIFLAPNSLNVPLKFEKLPKPFEISFQSHFFSVHTKCSSWQLHWNVSDQNQSTKSFLWEPQKEYIIYSKNDFVNQILWTSRI